MVGNHIQGKAKTFGIVDNNLFALWAMKEYLVHTLDGVTLEWMATRADTAIARCAVGRGPDVLLVDMPMCDIDGISVIRAIRERNRHTGLVAMTSFPLGEYASAAAMAGAQAIAGKNDLQGLRDIIRIATMGGTGSFKGIGFPLSTRRSPGSFRSRKRESCYLPIERSRSSNCAVRATHPCSSPNGPGSPWRASTPTYNGPAGNSEPGTAPTWCRCGSNWADRSDNHDELEFR